VAAELYPRRNNVVNRDKLYPVYRIIIANENSAGVLISLH